MLSNLGNIYYLATIFMRVYLIDTVLDVKDPETEKLLWFPGDRNATAIALALAWVLPNVVLLASDYFEMAVLEMGFNIRYHLRVNLLRKYLRYTDRSRALVPIQALEISIMEDIPDLVSQGYLILFDFWAMLGKITMVAIFILRELPRSALPLIVYPVLIVLHLIHTHRRRMDLMSKEGEAKSTTVDCVMSASRGFKLIKSYNKGSSVVRNFETILHNQRKVVMNLKSFNFWTSQFVPWITTLAIGFYVGISANLVLHHGASLGAIVQTISVLKDLGDRFSTLCRGVEELSKAISPLSALTFQLNLETDNAQRAKVFTAKQDYVLNFSSAPNFDEIPIVFRSLKIDHSFASPNLEFSTQIPQGCVLQIVGPHDSGKGQLLKKICGPGAAENVLLSPHLFALQVPHEPLFIESIGIFENLHLVTDADRHFDFDFARRGRRILKRLKLDKEWIIQQHDSDVPRFERFWVQKTLVKLFFSKEMRFAGRSQSLTFKDQELSHPSQNFCCDDGGHQEMGEVQEGGYQSWPSQLSNSEKWRFQLARAFVADPHVLIVHRPVDELDSDLKELVLSLLREFVDKRGLEMTHSPMSFNQRHPRTVIFSTGCGREMSIADYVWRVSATGGNLMEKTSRPQSRQLGAK
eukprot:symbB.v1.2.036040.t1/scaffold4980.1/size32161/1